jgi:F-type H+-transporting ATPase subunit delta
MIQAEARRFAQAALKVAATLDMAEDFLERFSLVADIHRKSRTFRHVLLTHRMDSAEKMKVLRQVFEGVLTDFEYQVLQLLMERNLVEELPAIARYMVQQAEARALRLRLTVVTPRSLEPEYLRELEARVAKALDRPLKVRGVTDPALIGGIKLRLGNTLMDGSVARRLERMREQLL